MSDLLLEVKVRFAPTYLATEGIHEIPIEVERIRMRRLKEDYPGNVQRRERTESIDVINFPTDKELPIRRGDTLRVEGAYNRKTNGYDFTAIHLLSQTRSQKDGRPLVSQTYYPLNHRRNQTDLGINLDP